MSFFEPPAAPDAPKPAPQGSWMGPPSNMLGTVVPLRLVLCRSADAVVAVNGVVAYPTGCEVNVEVRGRSEATSVHPEHPLGASGRPGGGLPDTLLRLGVEFADGAKATILDDPRMKPNEEPAPPVFFVHKGGGSPAKWSWEMWMWPLPPARPFNLVAEWPVHGIDLTRTEVDGSQLVEAAGRALELWPEAMPGAGGGIVGFASEIRPLNPDAG